MIGLDTNILVRYYVEDKADAATERQHQSARNLIESGEPLMVCKTVLLEMEWVMRGYYNFASDAVASVMRHLLSLPHVTVEDRDAVEQAVANSECGLDFADALHLACYRSCSEMASFDDRKFARRARKMGLSPSIVVPTR